MRSSPLLLLIALIAASILPAQCPPLGLGLTATGERMGDPFEIALFGTPGVSGMLGIDVSGGPLMTPVGTVCLGLTPGTLFSPFTLDPLGHTAFTGILPAQPFLTGFTAFLQAGASDITQPGALALSNGDSLTLRPPRLFVIDPGMAPGPFGGGVPGAFCVVDALVDVVISPSIPLAANVLDAAMAPSLGLIAFLLGNSSLVAFDATTLAPVLSMALPTSPGLPTKLGVDGATALVMYPGTPPSPFGGGTPGAIRTYSLPSGATGLTVSLASGNPTDMFALQGTGLAYLRVLGTVVPMDLVSGTLFPAIDMVPGPSGSIAEWRLIGNLLYCLMPGSSPNPFGGGGAPPALNAVDTMTQSALFPAAVSLGGAGPASKLRHGPSGGGNAIFVHHQSAGGIKHVNPATGGVNGLIPVSNGHITMELSDGGSEYLLMCNGIGCGGIPILQSMDPFSFLITTVSPVGAVQSFLVPVPSATFNKAYFVSGPSTLVPITTDPAVPPTSIVPLPVANSALRIVVD